MNFWQGNIIYLWFAFKAAMFIGIAIIAARSYKANRSKSADNAQKSENRI